MNLLKFMIPSRVRRKILGLFYSAPQKRYHVRGISRLIEEEINAVRRELDNLLKHSLVSRETRANRVYYSLRQDYVLYQDFLRLFNKTNNLGRDLIKYRARLGKIKLAMVSGNYLEWEKRTRGDVDLLMVGKIVLPQLTQLVRQEEKRRGIEINYTVMSEDEFAFRKSRHDPFIQKIIYGPRLMIIGTEEELLS